MEPEKMLLTTTEAAQLLGCSRATLIKWMKEKLIVGRQVNRRRLIPRQAVLDFIIGKEHPSEEEQAP